MAITQLLIKYQGNYICSKTKHKIDFIQVPQYYLPEDYPNLSIFITLFFPPSRHMAVRMENSAERSFEYFTKIVFIISPPSPESPEMNWKIPETVLHPQENRMREFRQKATVFADPYCTDYYAVLLVSEDIRRNRPPEEIYNPDKDRKTPPSARQLLETFLPVPFWKTYVPLKHGCNLRSPQNSGRYDLPYILPSISYPACFLLPEEFFRPASGDLLFCEAYHETVCHC